MRRLISAIYNRYIRYSGPGGDLLRFLDQEILRLEREAQLNQPGRD
jgi:hypothetical protein